MWKHPVEIAQKTLKPSTSATLGKVAPVRVAIEHDLTRQIPTLLGELSWTDHLVLVCDNQTWQAMGQNVQEALTQENIGITLANLGSAPKASTSFAEYITSAVTETGASGILGVGSGTINDLCKLAAHRLNIPYAICATAPSMNGYLSANASITVRGHKQSLPATLPTAALFDLDVLEAAPKRMIQAGIGDSLCRSTAQSDWLLSHFLLDTHYDALPFELLAPYEDAMLTGDMSALIKTLIFSGLGMVVAGGSHPASQGEHLMAHYLEMRRPEIMEQSFHGEQIAVTTLRMAKLQEKLLKNDTPPVLQPLKTSGYNFQKHFGTKPGAEAWAAVQPKLDYWRNAWKLNNKLEAKWPEIRAELHRIQRSSKELEAALKACNGPRKASDISLKKKHLEQAQAKAHWIRDRFTFLDLAAMMTN